MKPGDQVIYISASGRKWMATVNSILNLPFKDAKLPVVSLSFRNERGKLVTKERALPFNYAPWMDESVMLRTSSMVWVPLEKYPK